MNEKIDLLVEKEKMLDEKLEMENKKRKPLSSVQNVKNYGKKNKISDESYVQSFNYSHYTGSSLIPTAMVRIEADGMLYEPMRAMLDTGAHPNILSNTLQRKLNLSVMPSTSKVVGINGTPTLIKHKALVKIRPWFESDEYIEDIFWILPKHSDWEPVLPAGHVSITPTPNQVRIPYADPTYWKPSVTNILLGVNIFAKIITSVIARKSDGTVLLETSFGAVLFGTQLEDPDHTIARSFPSIEYRESEQLDKLLSRLWEMDQIDTRSHRTKEEELVEEHFMSTHFRDVNGIFVVTIPLKDNVRDIGSSRQIAFHRFMYLEKRLEKNEQVRQIYVQKMRESIDIGHLRPCTENPSAGEMVYYIPHHWIEKKFRIVYDASCKTDKGISLNDVQMLGEKLQRKLHDIIMRFRRHRIAVSADIKKMYNQVKLNRQQWNLQRCFWRESRHEPLREYWLTVVTFGLTSSAHLAVRSVVQAAREANEDFPLAASVIENDYYMDDCTSGASTEVKAIKLAKDMSKILEEAGFELCQWKSNSSNFMKEMEASLSESSLVFSEEDESSILGLKWMISKDKFTFEVKTPEIKGELTKRKIVSCIAKLYDPNGYISPVIIAGRIIVRNLWKLGIDWDQRVPLEIENEWKDYWGDIVQLERFRIDRWLGTLDDSKVQIHGFADASSQAYGAVIYIRIEHPNGSITSKLLVSKARVAPIKAITIPRLELSAAELLSRLLVSVQNSMEWKDALYYLWTDSSVALHWLNKEPHKLRIFVANRVQSIQDRTDAKRWHYVNTKENPADLLSRGLFPSVMVDNNLWLHGPSWLQAPSTEWPDRNPLVSEPPEVQDELKVFALVQSQPKLDISIEGSDVRVALTDYTNSLEKLVNIVAFMFRFMGKWMEKPTFKIRAKRITRPIGPPSTEEKVMAMAYLIRKEQELYYKAEVMALENGKNLPERTKISSLSPVLDTTKVMRVGGRLDRSDAPYEMRHPAIIPNSSRLAWLVIGHAHRLTKHGGVQIMMQFIRQKFWIPKLRNELRNFIHKCVTCARYNHRFESQLMSELPAERVQIGKPFLCTGVDYAGPFELKMVDKDGKEMIKKKCWVAVFVCLKTRAMHIDVVTDLTSIAFIACYERFIARRGRCEKMFSDNGTSFVGAEKELKKAIDKWTDKPFMDHLCKKSTEWHFMVPAAPHQGGIYEAAVKSMKFHLRRVAGNKPLPFEQFQTLLVQIEAVLNSRPIHPLSDDPKDVQALTPGHFLIGEPLVLPLPFDMPAQPTSTGAKLWKERQTMLKHFWNRWQDEYLTSLQERKKWRREKEPLRIGQLVLLKSENFPPSHWAMGRICELITSKDGKVRSVIVQTATSRLTRAVQKVCIVPLEM